MPTDIELAIMAYRSYQPSLNNDLEMPSWQRENRIGDDGFAASVFSKGNDVVVAFRGTDDPKTQDVISGNIPAAKRRSLADCRVRSPHGH